jgi:hypothetical protein
MFLFDASGTGRYWYFQVTGTFDQELFDLYEFEFLQVSDCGATCLGDADADGVIDCYDLSAGDVVVTEIMRDSATVSDAVGEWFEVYNASGTQIRLGGSRVDGTEGESFEISDIPLDAGEYAVLAISDLLETNGGVAVDFRYGSDFRFSNGADDQVSLTSATGIVMDSVAYTSGPPWPSPTGATMSFDGDPVTADNSDPWLWCAATTPFGDGDLGTPSAETDCVSCGSIISDTSQCGTSIDCVCSGVFSVGDRVVATFNTPSGAEGILLDAAGTVVNGWAADGMSRIGVRWDDWTDGDDADCETPTVAGGCGVCETAPDNNWYVSCGEITAME